MNYVIDIDDTLVLYPDSGEPYNERGGKERYPFAMPNIKEIEMCNYLYETDNRIILHTGRNWDQYDLTVEQLKEMNIKYHELVMGKPQGVYVDRDSLQSLEEL